MSGLRLLGQPVGSSDFATEFNALQIEASKAAAETLLRTVQDRHTALRLFTQCTLHGLPHLLGSEVLYAHDPSERQKWDAWVSPLSKGIDAMVEGFIAKLTGRTSVPADSLLIAYITIAQGGLGFMDPFTRAVPDFVLTMSRAARYAEHGVRLGRGEDNVRLPNSFSRLFSLSHNRDSRILTSFYSLLGGVGDLATTKECPDTLDYFLRRGLLRSARDRLRQAESTGRAKHLKRIARPGMRRVLNELLLPQTSYPLVSMCRSVPAHRKANDIFVLDLKCKLYLEIFPEGNRPTCLCGEVIDVHGMHPFSCRRVSKRPMHDRIRNWTAEPARVILCEAGIMSPGAKMQIEPKKTVPSLPKLRPHDQAFRPSPSLSDPDTPTIPYTRIGFDFVITPPASSLPPSQSDAASPSNKPAIAVKHLLDKERKKLLRDGACDSRNQNSLTGDEIIGELLRTDQVLIPAAISPLCAWGPMFDHFWFGTKITPSLAQSTFQRRHPNARLMHARATSHPCSSGVVQQATARWRASRAKNDHFYGQSYTCPTPKEYLLQKFGLVMTNTRSYHLRDAIEGNLIPPTDPEDDDYVRTPAAPSARDPDLARTDTPNDHVGNADEQMLRQANHRVLPPPRDAPLDGPLSDATAAARGGRAAPTHTIPTGAHAPRPPPGFVQGPPPPAPTPEPILHPPMPPPMPLPLPFYPSLGTPPRPWRHDTWRPP